MPSPDEHLVSTFPGSRKIYRMGVYQGTVSLGNQPSLMRDRVTSSVQTPGYRKVPQRLLAVNPYSKHIAVLSDPAVEWTTHYYEPSGYYDDGDWIINSKQFLAGPYNVANTDDPSQRAINRLLKTMSETKVNTLVTAAESKKTVDYVAKTATRLANAFRAIKKGDFTGLTSSLGITATKRQRKRFNKRYDAAKSRDAQEHKYSESSVSIQRTQTNVSKFAGETWLEYSYAVKPLLHDVYGHARALAELMIERQDVRRFVKGRAKLQSVKTVTTPGQQVTLKLESENFRWAEYGVTFRLQAGELNTFSQLGINNPLEVAWELVPFSFVADWFLPVGSFLSSLTATSGLIFLQGYKSTRDVSNTKMTVSPSGPWFTGSGIATWAGKPMEVNMQGVDIVRTPLTSFPSASFPSLQNPFGSGDDYGLKRALSSIALLQSLFLNRRATR